jgi:hypothetical protein
MAGKPGRNDPCPCGSGKKYKACCINKSQVRSNIFWKLLAILAVVSIVFGIYFQRISVGLGMFIGVTFFLYLAFPPFIQQEKSDKSKTRKS